MRLLTVKTKFLSVLLAFAAAFALVLAPLAQAAESYVRVYDSRTKQYVYVPKSQANSFSAKARSAWSNPIIKQAVIGAGVGAAAGALSDRSSLLRGAVIGTAAGAGTGLVTNSQTLQDKPMVKTALKGAIIGGGVSALTRGSVLKGAGLGAGIGAGAQLLNQHLLNNGNIDNY